MKFEELKQLAIQAGFEDGKQTVVHSGESELDEELCFGEYSCAETVVRLAKLLGIEVEGVEDVKQY